MEFITSNKGSKKLCYAGHAYTKKSQTKATIRWECSQRSGKQCKGCLTTDLAATEVRSTTEHSHEADEFAIAALKVRAQIKMTVETNRGKPGQIIADRLSTVPKEVAAATGKVESLKRSVRRAKRGSAPKEPKSISDIPKPLPEDYCVMRDENFMIFDNESENQRILIFATDDGLKLLGSADTCFMDGTHSIAPSQFAQLFCVRAPIGKTCVSAVYGLLPSKHQDVCEEFLTAVLEKTQ